MSEINFVHTHVHSEFSLLDGLSEIKKLVKRAKEQNMPAVALTDHGTMFGVIDFYRAAKEAEIKPLIGVETYLAPRKMTDRDSVIDKKPFHLLLLAKNQQGYQNLLKIASRSQLEGYYYRPRIDWDTLQQYSEGLIATSGCLAARIPQMVARGQDNEARDWIGKFQDTFGADSFYLELQQHDIPEIFKLNKWLVDYRQSGHSNVGLVATNDVHYIRKQDFEAHDVLLCIQTGASVKQPKRKDHDNEDAKNTRMAMSDNSYYLNSAEEMWDIWGSIAPEAVHNSLKIAEMCEVNLDTHGYHLPVFPVPQGYDAATYLRYLCEKGLVWRYGDRALSDPVLRERLDYELSTVNTMGFDTYFLIVWDLTQFAAHADIWWNVRGSGAGSLVAYSLGITLVDPIQNSLLFERFLNPGRVSMPDIDIDFPDDRRGEMIAYTALKYGEDKVAAIITFGTMGAKAAIKDVARAMDVDLGKVSKAVGLIPTEAKQKQIEEYVEGNPDLKKMVDEDAELQAVINMAKQLQGISRHSSVHAAGVIIADQPLDEYLPLSRVTGKDPSEGALKAVTQFPMETCESLGLLKVDFLGLSTLTIMRKAAEAIERFHGIHYDLNNIPYRHDDPDITDEQRKMLGDAFELMGRGETIGVFQLESTGMQSMLRDMRPKRFENIVAGVALYRPGPMDLIPTYNKRLHGEENPTYLHPALEPILAETYGIIVYQESIMQVASNLFGYELGEADLMRKAVSKKKEKDLIKHKAIFLERGPQNGVDVETAEAIFKDIEFFANYGFNKCLTGDTEIIDAQTGRQVTLDDLISGKLQVETTVTCDLDTLCLQPGKITDVMENGVKPVYRLTTLLGRRIEATANHPFYTQQGWEQLGELSAGIKIAVPRRLSVEGKKEWYLSELAALALLVTSGSHWIFLNHGNLDDESEKSATYGFKLLKTRLPDFDTEKVVRLPSEVFELTNEQIAQLIAAIWVRHGFLHTEHQTLTCNFNTYKIASQIQHLLLRFGIVAKIETCENTFLDLTTYNIRIVGDYNLQTFIRRIGRFCLRIQTIQNWYGGTEMYHALLEILHFIKSMNGGDIIDTASVNDIYWDKIVSIEPIGEQPTYDLTIEGTHNFIANDILVHNSHATDYAMVTVQTAYLKAHYPEEYMMAMLSTHRDDSTKIAHFLDECRRMNIPILPPDANYSALDFDIQLQEDGRRGIRFGLAGIKNSGEAAMAHIVKARLAGGVFEGIEDLCRRVDLRAVGKRALESLTKVGAMERFGNRAQVLAALDRIVSFSSSYHKDREIGRVSLFGDDSGSAEDLFGNLPNVKEPPHREMLGWEKELLGLYVTGRPADKFKDALAQMKTEVIAEIKTEEGKLKHDKTVTIAGEIIGFRKVFTQKGDAMVILQIEDWHETVDSIEVVLFPRNWAKVEAQIASEDLPELKAGEVIKITGKLDSARDRVQVIGELVTQNFTVMERSDTNGNGHQYAEAEPEWMTAEPAHINGHSGNGNHVSAYVPPPEVQYEGRTSPADWSPLPEDDGGFPPFDTEDDAPKIPRRCIVISLKRSDDTERDQRILKRLYNTLREYPGPDRFIILVEVGGKEYEMSFKNTSTNSRADELWAELKQMNGNVQWEVYDED